MSLWKAGALALMIPAALAAPAFAQGEGRQLAPALIFEELDADGNGAVTLEEMQAARGARFARTDADGDGALSRDEMLAQALGRVETRVDRMLELGDTDGDGQLTMAEMEAAREGGGQGRFGSRGPDPARMFERLDADGDGSVTEAEFDQGVASFRERMGRRFGGGRG
ncbi:MAG TPA: calcium-binding protein [Roseibacterium sp.]|nr:calcium-binding protein [Roseibacterium sp.]